jgi:hypothetical protein
MQKSSARRNLLTDLSADGQKAIFVCGYVMIFGRWFDVASGHSKRRQPTSCHR